MKSSENFKKVICAHLQYVAANDPLFAETLKKENKNIDECVNYILSTVQKSGCNGFADEEIFNMAIHYYDEDSIVGDYQHRDMKVIVNHAVSLSEEDIQKAKQEAVNKVISEEKEKLTKKKTAKKDPAKDIEQVDLFA
jgi:hypothetical protein